MGRFIFLSFGLLVVFLSLSGHCYRVFRKEMNWADAEKFCTEQHKGSHLVSFHSSEEVDFVVSKTRKILDPGFVWIGLNNVWKECIREWSDGTKLDYKTWTEESECIAAKTTDNQWWSRPCSRTQNVVCKFQA